MAVSSYQNSDTSIQHVGVRNDSLPINLEGDTVVYGIKGSEHIPVRTYQTQKEDVIPLVKQLFEPQQREIVVAGWQTLLLVLTITLVGLAKAFSTNRFKETYKSLFNYRVAQAICNEEKVFFHRVNVLLTINYLITISLLILQVKELLNYGNSQVTSGMFFFIILGFLLSIVVLKLAFAQFLAFVFNTPQLVNDYIFTITLFNNLLGILLLPTLSILYFTTMEQVQILSYIAIPVLLFTFIFRVVRLVVIGNLKGVSYFYIFLYICSLEILPLIVLIKIFILK